MKTFADFKSKLTQEYNANPQLANKSIAIASTGTILSAGIASGLMTKVTTGTVMATGQKVALYTAASLGAKVAVGVGLTALSVYAGYKYYNSNK